MAIIRGLKTAAILICSMLALGYLAGRFAVKPLPAAGLFTLFLWALPAAAGISAGWHSRNKAWKSGASAGLILWSLGVLALFWFLPQVLRGDMLLTSFFYALGSGALGGIFGLNLHLAKKREGQKE